jgi:hypothetical protein
MTTKQIAIDETNDNSQQAVPFLRVFELLTSDSRIHLKHLSPETKYILAIMLDNSADNVSQIMAKDIAKIDEMLVSMDWLTYPWYCLPIHTFRTLFRDISGDRLCFFCGMYRVWYGSIKEENRSLMIDALWIYFQSPEYKAKTTIKR